MSSNQSSSEGDEKKPRVTPPPGIELQFRCNFPADCTSPFAALVLAVHWSTVHTTNLRLTTPEGSQTETLPDNWPSMITSQNNSSSRYIPLDYKNPETGKTKRVKIQELAFNGIVAVMVAEVNQGGEEENVKVATLHVSKYVNVKAVEGKEKSVQKVYDIGNLWELCETVKNELLKDEVDTRKPDPDKTKTPYTSNLKETPNPTHEPQPSSRDPLANPLFIPSRNPQNPSRGIGSSDLDPFGGITAGGMVLDPRGFRRPNIPGGLIPGARFDPIGPVPPSFGGRGGMGGRGAPRLPFGFIDPDHERAHGYDDMFS